MFASCALSDGAPGSGVWLHAGRSLRVKNREALSAVLNLTKPSEWVRGSWLRRWPYRLETRVGLCRAASRAGYATIQLGTERLPRQLTGKGKTGLGRKRERCVRHLIARLLCVLGSLTVHLAVPAQAAQPGEIPRARDHLLPPRVPRAEAQLPRSLHPRPAATDGLEGHASLRLR